MKIKSLIDEDFVNYKKPSMFISSCYCDWKCCTEAGMDVCICQNHDSFNTEIIDTPDTEIVERYINNPITKAIVIAGFEPFLQFDEVVDLIKEFRLKTSDDIVIYTGYYRHEKENEINKLAGYKNIIVKFGRFIPNQEKHFDEILGVYLVNKEQYAERL